LLPPASLVRRLFCAALLTAALRAEAVKTDIVVLANGDRFTGEVDSLDRGRLTFKTDDAGTLYIEWDNVRSVIAKATFDVTDLHGGRYVGTLDAGEDKDAVYVVGADASRAPVKFNQVAGIQRIGATFWQRLDGSLDAGASYTSASELFTLDLAASISTERPGWQLSADASSTVTSQPDVDETRRNTPSVSYGRRFPELWLLLAQGRLEQNRELGFDLRSSVTAGGGRYLVQTQRARLLAAAGVSVNREAPVDGQGTTNFELTALFSLDRYSYDFPKIDVAVVAAGFASLNESGRYRFELQASLKRELVKDFYASLRGYESHDSKPPTQGAPTDDYGITFSLGWSF
jgi:hypothetical protein